MTSKAYFYQFSEQKVFASEHAPISFNLKSNYVLVAMNNYIVAVYDVNNNLNIVNSFPVCGCVIKIDYCSLDDYIITLETKDHTDTGSNTNYSIRTYHNWRSIGEHNKMKFRAALGAKSPPTISRGIKSPILLSGVEKVIAGDLPYRESAIEVLEFLHLNHPSDFSIYTNQTFKRSFSMSKQSQNFEDLSSVVAISENTYVHFYSLCQTQKTCSPHLSQYSAKRNSKAETELSYDFVYCFQHLYTINFNFIVIHVCIFEHILAAASKDKVQIIQILENKEKCARFSDKLESERCELKSSINLEIGKCGLTSISNERKLVASKQKIRPKEILGPTHDLDTASITLLRYADSKELTFSTLLFRKYNAPTEDQHILNVHIAKVNNFDDYGFLVVKRHEIVHYSFYMKKNEVVRLAEYYFKNESVIGVTFADNVNLIHVAFSNGDLITYNSRLCARELFDCENIYKKVSLTKMGKVTLMGLREIQSSGKFVLGCCKYNLTDDHDDFNAVVVSSDSWNFYMFSQPIKDELKKEIISNADYKGTKKLLQMILCGILVFPTKEELNNNLIMNIVICCLKSESFYSEIVPNLLSSNNLQISNVLNIFQTLESKELYNKHLFKLYTRKCLMKADFSKLTEDQFRWIVIKALDVSVTLLFDIIVTNYLEDFLKVDLLMIEGINPINFESVFIKILYYSAHGHFDEAEPMVAQLDENEFKNILKSQIQLLYQDKRHTSFGWVLNRSNPTLYAEVMAYCFINNAEQHNGFTNLEVIKQLGQCSYILVLEELLNFMLKEAGVIVELPQSGHIEMKYTRKSSSSIVIKNIRNEYKQNKMTAEMYHQYLNQVLLLYHEFSFNAIELCPHKIKKLCRKVPIWLKEHRHNNILNLLPPFDGLDPFSIPHGDGSNQCFSMCCQSYLIRLQCLLSWSECFQYVNTSVIEASCESNNHPAWQSLQFLLLFMKSDLKHKPLQIINFFNKVECHKDDRLVEMFLSLFANLISVEEWEEIIQNKPSNISLSKLLKSASLNTTFDELLVILKSLKECNSITKSDYDDWVEKAGRLHNRDILFKLCIKQLFEENVESIK